jgi:hypothetical protein
MELKVTETNHRGIYTDYDTLNDPNLNLCALQDELPQSTVHITREHMISCIMALEP